MSTDPRTLAVLVGGPVEYVDADGRVVCTAFRKQVVDGPVAVGPTNLDGDEQGDLRVHGGPHKAVLAYSAEHSQAWRAIDPELGEPGAFGENLHVSGLTEADVCIGDRWAVGSALFEVSQPRQPCWKVEHRWGRDGLVAFMEETGRTGWYLRVVTPGVVAAGDTWTLEVRPNPRWSVATANDVMHHRRDDLDAAASLASLDALAPSWHRTLTKRAERLADGLADDVDLNARRVGPTD